MWRATIDLQQPSRRNLWRQKWFIYLIITIIQWFLFHNISYESFKKAWNIQQKSKFLVFKKFLVFAVPKIWFLGFCYYYYIYTFQTWLEFFNCCFRFRIEVLCYCFYQRLAKTHFSKYWLLVFWWILAASKIWVFLIFPSTQWWKFPFHNIGFLGFCCFKKYDFLLRDGKNQLFRISIFGIYISFFPFLKYGY